MKIRHLIILSTILAAVTMALLLWLKGKTGVETPPRGAIVSKSETFSPRKGAFHSSNGSPAMQTNTAASRTVAPTESPKGKIDQTQGLLSMYNEVPVDFYGKLEDQFGNPVVGAQIKASITVISGIRQGADWLSTTSDASGLFAFHGHGQDIGLTPQKEGYVLTTTQTLFKYSHLEEHPFSSDASTPTVIRMRKLQGAQPLIAFEIKTYAPVDGRTVHLDLHTGERVEQGGDLELHLQSQVTPNIREGYDWSVVVQPADGGIVRVDDANFEQMLEAPENGFENQFEATYRNADPSWSSRLRNNFYFYSHARQCYGKFRFSITTDVIKDGGALIQLTGYLNPAGSRNLEVDAAKVTTAHP